MQTDDEGYPGWTFVLDEYAKEDYKNLLNDERWNRLQTNALLDKANYFKKVKESEDEFFKTAKTALKANTKAPNLYQQIKTHNPYLSKQQQDYSISLKINDSTNAAYHVHLPKNYNPKKKYAALLFLHGGVRFSQLAEYQIPQKNLGGWNRFYTKYAALNEVILVFPTANKTYNWMTSDDGFFMIPKIVQQLKTALNIDDNKVFISGHSNGATGSFSYLMKQPTPFAGFYGFNTHPKVYTGGTFIENILNRSFINFSTDQDYYYPPNANDTLTKVMNNINADYKDYRYNGFPHWFPEFDESEPAYKILFTALTKSPRKPFPQKITWEFDDNRYGNIDWLSNIKLDTLATRKREHKQLNFKIEKELKYNKQDSLVFVNVDKQAFDFPRKSGKITASYEENTFTIQTSCIGSLSITISPEMINLKKKVKVYINDKLYFNQKIKYDPQFMLNNFIKTKDRSQIWVNVINLKI
ncbi:alpha/beta hydrolase-fold protein [Flavobacterium sp. SM2513]|uniref:alpha/beta hydrolase-fold protein n=1 Tax=Flavobacterium sp. SM2513 TaxID=3424766 RepID=UPI003D7F217C